MSRCRPISVSRTRFTLTHRHRNECSLWYFRKCAIKLSMYRCPSHPHSIIERSKHFPLIWIMEIQLCLVSRKFYTSSSLLRKKKKFFQIFNPFRWKNRSKNVICIDYSRTHRGRVAIFARLEIFIPLITGRKRGSFKRWMGQQIRRSNFTIRG